MRRLRVLLLAALLGLPPLVAHAQTPLPVQVRADYVREDRARRVLYARGNVVLTYQDLVLRSDELVLELDQLDLEASGNVVLDEAGQVVTASHLTYNLRSRLGSLDAAETRWREPRVMDPIHLRATRLEGSIDQRICLRSAEVTTCDLDDPRTPYKITGDQIDLIPQDKLVIRNASLYLFGRKVLTLPLVVIFLRERRQARLIPLIGYNEEEGFFVKAATTYFINDENYGFIYTDWMEKIGFGTGFEHILKYDRGEGDYFFYLLGNKKIAGNEFRTRLQHRHAFGVGFSAGVFLDYYNRQHGDGDYYTNIYGTLDALYADRAQTINLFASYARIDTPLPGGSSERLSVQPQYSRQIATNLTGRLQVPYSQRTVPGGPDLEATPRLDLTYTARAYTLQMVAEGRVDIEGDAYQGDTPYSLSRLPEVSIVGFPRPFRLGRATLSYQLQGGAGNFLESIPGTLGVITTTAGLRLDAQAVLAGAYPFGPRASADMRLSARGSYYTSGDARGIFSGMLGITYNIGGTAQGRLTYNYKDNLGKTPFLFDRDESRMHNALLNLTYRQARFGADLSGGYDLLTSRPNPLVLRLDWLPLPNWTVTVAGTHDLATGTFTSAEATLWARLSNQWEFVYRGIYTPTTGDLLHDRIQLNYYQDCWLASATYVGSRQEIWIEVGLTAFPQARGAVGLGQTGILFNQPFLPPLLP